MRDTFLAKGHNRTLELTIESLAKNQDAWRTIITAEEMKSMGLTRPLLQSTVLFENSMFRLSVLQNKKTIYKKTIFFQESLKLSSLSKTFQIIPKIC